MTLKELQIVDEAMFDLINFARSNCEVDESGIYKEINEKYFQAKVVIDKERDKLYLRNAVARAKRRRNKKQTT